jgi:hypothetical protein
MSAPLTNLQKRTLSLLARRAFNRATALARGRGEQFQVKEDDYRHEEVIRACGKHGLRCCSQDDYQAVRSHVLDLVGEHGAAFHAQLAAGTEKRRQAEAVLVRECEKANVDLAYADRICLQQFKCCLAEASEKQIWCLVYTIRNRAAAKRRGGARVPASLVH